MKIAICKLKSTAPYSQSRHHSEPEKDKELKNDYEERTWRERMHYDPNTLEVFIPPMQFANSLKVAAKYLNIQIPGKGKSTFTKNFESGVMVVDPLSLNVKRDDVIKESFYVPSDGTPGGARRVIKNFGMIPQWEGEVKYYILDDIITENVFKRVLETSGNLIGIGRFRPRNRGYYGRFEVINIKWSEQ